MQCVGYRAIGIKPWEDPEISVQSTDEVTDFRNSSAYGYEKEGLFMTPNLCMP